MITAFRKKVMIWAGLGVLAVNATSIIATFVQGYMRLRPPESDDLVVLLLSLTSSAIVVYFVNRVDNTPTLEDIFD